jgi:hypothetical protein
MDNKKFEQLIDMIINENEEQARELFHEIVVDKSREIYESIMEEEMMMGEEDVYEEDEDMGGEVGGFMDEISAEEDGDDFEDMDDEDELEIASDDDSFDMDDMDDMGDEEEIEDAVIRIEDKLDQLMAEFESMMGDSDMGDEEVDVEDDTEVDVEDDEETEEEVMEAVQLQKVSVTHGDNGAYTKSPVAANAGKAGMDSQPVKASTHTETGRSAPSAQNVKGAGSFKNAPGHKKQDLSSAPKPETKQASGVNTKSPVAK